MEEVLRVVGRVVGWSFYVLGTFVDGVWMGI